MATEAKLRQLADKGCPVYYFYSSERYLVRQAVAAAVRMLSALARTWPTRRRSDQRYVFAPIWLIAW